MLQLLHIDVLKVDQVLHMRDARKAASSADDVRDSAGPLLVCFLASPIWHALVCSVCVAASRHWR
jgi:hypothetical protein